MTPFRDDPMSIEREQQLAQPSARRSWLDPRRDAGMKGP